jgi:FkbM family methyltransferase
MNEPEPASMKLMSVAGRLCARWPLLERAVARIGHAWPDNRVIQSLCFHTGKQAFLSKPDAAERVAKVGPNEWLSVTLQEYTSRHIYFHGTYEPEVSELIRHLAQPRQTWVDVGANLGFFTVLAASIVGPHGKVVAFEPNPAMADSIQRSLNLNQATNVVLVRLAISDTDGEEATLYVPAGRDSNCGQSSLLRHENVRDVCEVSVPTTTLDRYFSETGLRPDFMKVDIEGLEILAFRGMANTLMHSPPKGIICELSQLPDCLATPHELIEHLAQYSYRPYCVRRDGLIPHVAGNPIDPADYNFIFVHPSAEERVKSLVIA